MRKCYFYGIYNKNNSDNIIYVGQHNYIKENDFYMGSGKNLLNLYKKEGKENFSKVIFEKIIYNEKSEEDRKKIGEREKFYINKYKKLGQAELNIKGGSNPCISLFLQENETVEQYKKRKQEENKEIIKEYDKKYYLENKEKIKEKRALYYLKNKEKILEKSKQYREKNKETIKNTEKQYREKNKELIKLRKKKYREKNKELIKLRKKEKYEQDRKNILKRQKAVKHMKKNNVLIFKEYSKINITKEKKEFVEKYIIDFNLN